MKQRKKIFGVGILDADYQVYKRDPKFICPVYGKWLGILTRCYSTPFLKTHPSYAGCKVCDEWLTFSNFKRWMEQQNWEGKALDKDLIGDGKLYSPENCVFISQSLNNFLLTNSSRRGKLPLGVTLEKKKYRADIKRNGKSLSLGRFLTAEDAHRRWQIEKRSQANALFLCESDERVKSGLEKIIDRLDDDILNRRLTSKL